MSKDFEPNTTANKKKCVIGCTAFFVCTGLIVLVVGVAMLFVSRTDTVARYNKAVDAWNSPSTVTTLGSLFMVDHTVAQVMRKTKGNNYNDFLDMPRVGPEPVHVLGNTDGVKSASSTYFRIEDAPMQNNYFFQVITNGIAEHAMSNQTRWFQNNFDIQRGGKYLSKLCVVMKFTSPRSDWEIDTEKQSCEYPFTKEQQEYEGTSPSGTVQVTLRSRDDPYIQLQEITQGKGFGEQRDAHIAVILIVIGSLIVLATIAASIYMCCKTSKRDKCDGSYVAVDSQSPSLNKDVV